MSSSEATADTRPATPERSADATTPRSRDAIAPEAADADAAPHPRTAAGHAPSTAPDGCTPSAAPASNDAGIPRHRQPRVGVLAVQGAFAEHVQRLRGLGCAPVELRQGADLDRPLDALVLPGGESTTQSRLLRDAGLLGPLRDRIARGLPTLGTCAGLILMAERIEGAGDVRGLDPQAAADRAAVEGLRTLPVTVSRNAYGRQLGSFHAEGTWHPAVRPAADGATPASAPAADGGASASAPGAAGQAPTVAARATNQPATGTPVPLTFIRAPRIERLGPGVQPLVTLDGQPVAVQYGSQIGAAFHPELDEDERIYRRLLDLAQ